MIKPHLKPKKTKPIGYYQKKADRLLQELGRQTYDRCLVCGGEYCCLHHFVYKSQSTALRYDWENAIPLCVSCHYKIHAGKNDTIPGEITLIKGQDWINNLKERRKEGAGNYFGKGWYKEKIEYLEQMLDK